MEGQIEVGDVITIRRPVYCMDLGKVLAVGATGTVNRITEDGFAILFPGSKREILLTGSEVQIRKSVNEA